MYLFSPERILFLIPALLIALTFHEYAHGKVAYLLGDPTAKNQGRLTLNPLSHLDPIGTLMVLFAGFGWAKPVPINPFFFQSDRRRGMMLVGLAGPVMNLVLAYLSAVVLQIVSSYGIGGFWLNNFLYVLIQLNIILAIFNLIPVPPLDGSRILAGILPRQGAQLIYSIENYGMLIIILLIITGGIQRIILPLVQLTYGIIIKLSGLVFF